MNYEVYFKNHSRAMKFPWSIYHKPLLNDLIKFLNKYVTKGSNILVIGPGDFQELDYLLSLNAQVSVLDIDPRVIEMLKTKYPGKFKDFFLVDDSFNGYPSENSFNVIYAKEVIEHIPNSEMFLKKCYQLLVGGGHLWLSTPNYGFFLLPFLESTILEIIARISGFSRKNIHPAKFSSRKLEESLKKCGFKVIESNKTFLKLALTINGHVLNPRGVSIK
jgi:2-polyprenyl-3-methyl-5-hydroxy-6-metoxy-1,4-benzoquinol methylase